MNGSFKCKWSSLGTHGFGCMASQSFRNVDFSSISDALNIKKVVVNNFKMCVGIGFEIISKTNL